MAYNQYHYVNARRDTAGNGDKSFMVHLKVGFIPWQAFATASCESPVDHRHSSIRKMMPAEGKGHHPLEDSQKL